MKEAVQIIFGLALIVAVLYTLTFSSWLWATIKLIMGGLVIGVFLIGLGLTLLGITTLYNKD